MVDSPDSSSQDQQQQVLTAQSQAPTPTVPAQRAFTLKSILFGLGILFFTIAITGYNDFVLKQSPFVMNHFPPGPYFLVICIALFWNPICSRLSPNLCLNHKELAVSLVIVLSGVWLGASGLNRFFPHNLINSWNMYENQSSWQSNKTFEYLPDHLFPLGGKDQADNAPAIQGSPLPDDQVTDSQTHYEFNAKDLVYKNFATGIPEGADIPYQAWYGPLAHWIPLIIVFSIALLSLSLIVHRQWSNHEQLTYPLAQIGGSFIDRSDGRTLPSVFYKRSFWIAAAVVFGFHFIRFIHAWFPSAAPGIEVEAWFGWYYKIFPVFTKSNPFGLLKFGWYFSLIGITFFLSREIGLTLGLSHFLLAFISAQLYISTGSGLSGGDVSNSRAGAYLAYAAVIIYTGRYYYWSVLKKALNFKAGEEHEVDGIFAMRIFLLAVVGMLVVLCTSCELSFPIALFYTLLVLLLFLVFTRIICETGIPFMQAGWHPGMIIGKVFGVTAIGAAPLVMIYYLGLMLTADPKECMMPYVSNSLKIAEKQGVNLKRLTKVVGVILIFAIVASIFMKMTEHYTIGANRSNDGYGQKWAMRGAMSKATSGITELTDLGQLDKEASIFNINPQDGTFGYMFLGAAGVFIFFALRFRFTGFPLHPVLFLVWGTWPMSRTFYCFLIGWLIRELIVRFGGGQVYQSCKPFFIGLIFGELATIMLGLGTGFIYHFSTIPEGEAFWYGGEPTEFNVFAR